ncbi:MAG: hypothetical protein K2N07_05930, partial [Desulfovibrio sp.]|nr:hypothetical protein [Desulfovibrio sp.]
FNIINPVSRSRDFKGQEMPFSWPFFVLLNTCHPCAGGKLTCAWARLVIRAHAARDTDSEERIRGAARLSLP